MSTDDDTGTSGIQRIVTLGTTVDATKSILLASVRTDNSSPQYFVTSELNSAGTQLTFTSNIVGAGTTVEWDTWWPTRRSISAGR